MRNWLKAFRPASFRGAPFHVDIEEAQGARRLSVSPIAYAETSVIEDMGRSPSTWSLTAYTVGDTADAEALALMAAFDAKGPSPLVLPMIGPRMARVTEWSLSRERQIAGYVAFSVSLIEEGLSAVPFMAPAAGAAVAQIVSGGLAGLGSAMADAVSGIPVPRRVALSARATEAAERIASAAGLCGVRTDSVAILSDIDFATSRAASDPAAWAQAIAGSWRGLALAADPVSAQAESSIALAAAADDGSPAAVVEGCAVFCCMAITAVRREYAARQDAAHSRAALRSAFAGVSQSATRLGSGVTAWIAAVAGEAALLVSKNGASRAPLVRVETGLSLPSVVLAHRIYGDPNRAGEIVARNSVSTPALMPVAIEAVAP